MIENFGAPTLQGVGLNDDGTLKRASGQSVLFYNKTELKFRAKQDVDPDIEAGNRPRDLKCGKIKIDPKTGLPFKESFEETRLFVRIETPGDKTPYDGPATDYHKREFQKQYEFFLRGGGIPDGHLITQFDFIPGHLILDMRVRMGIHTIEQLSEADEIKCTMMPELWELRDYAKEWVRINSPEGAAAKVSELRSKNEALARENEQLRSKLVGADGRPMAMPSAMPTAEPAKRNVVKTTEITLDEFKKGK
jgi:hypothetical protein